MNNLIVLIGALTLLQACTPNGGNGGSDQSPALVRPQYRGDLNQKAQQIFDSKNESFFYPCDKKFKEQILEVTSAIEANKSNIIEMQKKNISEHKTVKVVKLNGFDFLDYGPKIENMDQWNQSRYSWEEIFNEYKNIKNNLNSKSWVWVNSTARSLIFEDDNRIMTSMHPGTRRSACRRSRPSAPNTSSRHLPSH